MGAGVGRGEDSRCTVAERKGLVVEGGAVDRGASGAVSRCGVSSLHHEAVFLEVERGAKEKGGGEFFFLCRRRRPVCRRRPSEKSIDFSPLSFSSSALCFAALFRSAHSIAPSISHPGMMRWNAVPWNHSGSLEDGGDDAVFLRRSPEHSARKLAHVLGATSGLSSTTRRAGGLEPTATSRKARGRGGGAMVVLLPGAREREKERSKVKLLEQNC